MNPKESFDDIIKGVIKRQNKAYFYYEFSLEKHLIKIAYDLFAIFIIKKHNRFDT